MSAKRKPGSGKATVKSEQFEPVEITQPAGKIVRAQTMAPEPAKTPEPTPDPATPERAMARFKVNSDNITTVAHGPANYPVKNGEVELPATAEWWRPLVDAGVLTPL